MSIGFKKTKEPRRFWITDPEQYYEHFIHTDKEEAMNCGDFIIETIEASAYDALLKECDELKAILRKFNSTGTDGCATCDTGRVTLFRANDQCLMCAHKSTQESGLEVSEVREFQLCELFYGGGTVLQRFVLMSEHNTKVAELQEQIDKLKEALDIMVTEFQDDTSHQQEHNAVMIASKALEKNEGT